ncbi:MAG TPA: asparaginase domain-containing protein [Limnobacter sp.]|nr:asparaginase domain-containing protein [Limnobacter sp.]
MRPEGSEAHLPRLTMVATGGTIAGESHGDEGQYSYTSAKRSADSLLMAVPDLLRRARWNLVTPYAIGSQNLSLAHMLQLRATLCQCLANPEVDGVLVTHGTDTVEDMLYFLYLTLPPDLLNKPLVFTAAMLPADHPQADGPGNLRSAVEFILQGLAHPKAALHGRSDAIAAPSTFVPSEPIAVPFGLVMQGLYTPAAWVEKQSTSGLDAFDGPCSVALPLCSSVVSADSESSAHGALAAHLPQGFFHALIETTAEAHLLFESLEVAIVYCTPGNGPIRQLKDLLSRKPAAVVVAAPGHGNVPDELVLTLRKLLLAGVDVIRASRVPSGGVQQGGEFFQLDEFRLLQQGVGQFSESGDLTINKAAVLARLRALARSLTQ